ncbi:hypothetical protein NPIL_491061 [Nephila pilipes]|uniref:Uncharacterized protein n=1 Tax=Nephila pilipes TaxID=299642 RepID=A0A8X6TI43_NEPPI|nr:hypothetical protein NPIL_491061 [Nephila pilipes]
MVALVHSLSPTHCGGLTSGRAPKLFELGDEDPLRYCSEFFIGLAAWGLPGSPKCHTNVGWLPVKTSRKTPGTIHNYIRISYLQRLEQRI